MCVASASTVLQMVQTFTSLQFLSVSLLQEKGQRCCCCVQCFASTACAHVGVSNNERGVQGDKGGGESQRNSWVYG